MQVRARIRERIRKDGSCAYGVALWDDGTTISIGCVDYVHATKLLEALIDAGCEELSQITILD